MRRVLVIRGGAIGDVILTLPAVGALRLAFPSARIDVMGDAKRACLAGHPTYADAIADAEQWEIYRLFSRAPQVPPRLAAYLSAFELILSYLPTPDAIFTDNLRRYCPGEVIAWPPHPRTGVHATDHLLQPVLRLWTPPRLPSPASIPVRRTSKPLTISGDRQVYRNRACWRCIPAAVVGISCGPRKDGGR
jgi:hypothetical protein